MQCRYYAIPRHHDAFRERYPSPKTAGGPLETLVFRHLRECLGTGDEVSYFRNKAGLECDFVVQANGSTIAVEVTTSRSSFADKRQTIGRVREALGADRAVLIHAGVEEVVDDEAHILPVHRFMLDPGRCLEVSRK